MGSNGFAEFKAEAKPFGRFDNMTAWSNTAYSSPFLLWQTDDRLYQIDFANREVEILFDAAGDKIRHVASQYWHVSGEYDGPNRPVIYIVTKSKRHYILMKYPREKMELNLSGEFDKSQIAVCAYQDDIFVKHYGIKGAPSPFDRKERQQWIRRHGHFSDRTYFCSIYKVDQGAKPVLIDSYTYHSVNSNRLKKARQVMREHDLFQGRVRKYQTSISPILFKPAWNLVSDWHWWDPRDYSPIVRVFFEFLEFTHPANVGLACCVSAVMVFLAGFHGWSRRRGWGEYIFWLVFVGAFNVAGLLAYIALKHTVVIQCSGCGRRRGLERVDCPACGLELPEPARREVDLVGAI